MLKIGIRFFYIALISLTFSQSIHCRPVSKDHETLLDYLTSRDFDSKVLSKQLLRAGLVSGQTDISGKRQACLLRVQVRPAAGVESSISFIAPFACEFKNGACEELLDCADRIEQKIANSKEPSIADVPYVSKLLSQKNKFNDNCRIDPLSKEKSTLYQFYDRGRVVEQVCLEPYTCNSRPAGAFAACAPKTEIFTDKQGNHSKKVVCPQLNDCINNEVPLPSGYSEKELSQMPGYQRDRITREWNTPVKTSGVTPVGTAPQSSQSFVKNNHKR